MPAKTYNELIIQYSNEDGFLHYANEAEGASLDPSLDRKAHLRVLKAVMCKFSDF